MQQPTLFGDDLPAHCKSGRELARQVRQEQPLDSLAGPLARTSDPATSQAAAADTRPKLNRLQQAFVTALWSMNEPATAAEVARVCYGRDPSASQESYRKRAGECEQRGHIKISGTRTCKISGKSATIYALAGH